MRVKTLHSIGSLVDEGTNQVDGLSTRAPFNGLRLTSWTWDGDLLVKRHGFAWDGFHGHMLSNKQARLDINPAGGSCLVPSRPLIRLLSDHPTGRKSGHLGRDQ